LNKEDIEKAKALEEQQNEAKQKFKETIKELRFKSLYYLEEIFFNKSEREKYEKMLIS
jgi:hypothetical protein